jgi:hypothetical protein
MGVLNVNSTVRRHAEIAGGDIVQLSKRLDASIRFG